MVIMLVLGNKEENWTILQISLWDLQEKNIYTQT